MKAEWKILLVVLVVIVLGVGFYSFFGSDVSISGRTVAPTVLSAQIYHVGIGGEEFSPKEIFVKVGDIVVWTNYDDAEHTVTSVDSNVLDSGLISVGELYFYRFESVGEYSYRCDRNPLMEGRISVESNK